MHKQVRAGNLVTFQILRKTKVHVFRVQVSGKDVNFQDIQDLRRISGGIVEEGDEGIVRRLLASKDLKADTFFK